MSLEDEKIMDHLLTLTEYDDTGFFSGWKDGSSALVNVLKAFSTNTYILNKFRKEPELCNRIYYNLDGVSFIDGKPQANRLIFANILMQYCLFSPHRPKEDAPTFHIGKNYKIATNVTELSGKWLGFGQSDEKTFFLQQQKEITQNVRIVAKEGNPEATEQVTEDLDEGKQYFPLEMVYFVNEDEKNINPETGEELPSVTMMVPAIYVKAMADAEKWEDINYFIRITADILAVVLGIATLATTGNPYLILAAMADLSLAGIDLTVQALRQEIAKLPGGEQFLKDWDLIYGVGGAIVAAPQLIVSAYRGIFVLMPKAAKNVQQGLRTMAISLFLDLNAGRFERSQLTFLQTTEWVFPTKGAWNSFKANVIAEEGVALFEVQVFKNNRPVNQYIISYQKEILAQGVMSQDKYFTKVVREIAKNYYSKASLLKTLTELWESKSYQLIEILDHRGSPIGEFDEIFHNKRIFVEDKSAQGLLQNINPKTGKPWQTFESWANKQVYEKTYNRIKALEVAKTTRARLSDGLSPDIAVIRDIRKLEFQILETDIEIQKAVHSEMQRLKKEFPDWEFTAKFGK
ncbi:hypothetical protein [uncultured Chryseobacterium sp.]|uniref:hypothetical protein n=1 Tax=uncultured Chryseobacterium sp. TaxID=259322 RepID=UPI0026004B12|nr:hypothetical protein [uncultured Chryseobacterium sp.]